MSGNQEIFIKNQEGNWKKETVKKGFAAYLLMKRGALPYSKQNIQRIDRLNIKAKKQRILEKENAEKIRNQLNKLQITFKLEKKEEKIFGSVRIEDILKELSKQDIYLEKKQFLSFSPLFSLGEHLVNIKLGEWDNQFIKSQLKIIILEK